jgi:uncharacterized membrane protein YukC
MLMFIMLIVPWGENIFKTIGHVGLQICRGVRDLVKPLYESDARDLVCHIRIKGIMVFNATFQPPTLGK